MVVLLELKLDATFTTNQKTDSDYWSGAKNVIVVPRRRLTNVQSDAVNYSAMNDPSAGQLRGELQIIDWPCLKEMIVKNLHRRSAWVPPLLECVADFAETAGWVLSPALDGSTALLDAKVSSALSESMQALQAHLNLVNALYGSKYQALSAGFPDGKTWAGTAKNTSTTKWILDIDTPLDKWNWPLWIGYRPGGSERIWAQLFGDGSGNLLCWMPDMHVPVNLGDPSDTNGFPQIPTNPNETQKEMLEAICRLSVETLQAIAKHQPTPGNLEFRRAWDSVVALHELFATMTAGLYDKRATDPLSPVQHHAELAKDDEVWTLRQWRGIEHQGNTSSPLIRLETSFPPDKPVSVTLKYHLWDKNDEIREIDLLEGLTLNNSLRDVVNRLRGHVETVTDDDTTPITTRIMQDADAILSISTSQVSPGTYDQCLQLMREEGWETFRTECKQGLKKKGTLGMTARYATKAQRMVLQARDGHTCIHPGCTTQASRCIAHHIVHWDAGGPTDVENVASS